MQEIQRTDKQEFICPFCSRHFKGLAYHTTQRHGITGKELRKKYGLKTNYQLITPSIKEKHRTDAIKYDMGEHLKRVGKQTRYEQGHEGHTRQNWSEQALKELSERVKKYGCNTKTHKPNI